MSSNYLNYELSKELKELGVEFKPLWRDIGFYWFGTDELGYDCHLMQNGGGLLRAPSTAQLADEIQKRSKCGEPVRSLWLDPTLYVSMIENEYDPDKPIVVSHDPCLTTALGKALIALVTAERSEDKGENDE